MIRNITRENLYEFVNELGRDMSQIEKTMKRTENALRYLELNARYDAIRVTKIEFMEKFGLE